MKRGRKKYNIKKENKRSQQSIEISFSMIFTILIIVIVIVISVIVIQKVLSMQKCAQTALFVKDLKDQVNTAWQSHSNEFTYEQNLPSDIKYVCFANLSLDIKGGNLEGEVYEILEIFIGNYNMFFYPPEKSCDIPKHKIDHINLKELTDQKNPYCFAVKKSKVKLKLTKEGNENLVRISQG